MNTKIKMMCQLVYCSSHTGGCVLGSSCRGAYCCRCRRLLLLQAQAPREGDIQTFLGRQRLGYKTTETGFWQTDPHQWERAGSRISASQAPEENGNTHSPISCCLSKIWIFSFELNLWKVLIIGYIICVINICVLWWLYIIIWLFAYLSLSYLYSSRLVNREINFFRPLVSRTPLPLGRHGASTSAQRCMPTSPVTKLTLSFRSAWKSTLKWTERLYRICKL